MMRPKSRLTTMFYLALLTTALSFGFGARLHAQDTDGAYGGSGSGEVIPAGYQSGSFFNRQLGTVFRFSYHNQGYGTQEGVVTLGSMKVFNMEGATFFLDGKATLSEDFGGGYNLGVGYRKLMDTNFPFDAQRINGASFWTDGQSTSSDNFFSQLGFNLESLGESFDARIGGYFPLERNMVGDPKLTGLNDPRFLGNNLVSEVFMQTTDTAHSVIDGELAKRIGNLEAWAFLGGYQLGGGGIYATGYRVGVRGYAMPDLALSLQVTDDDVYSTNVVFGLTWFVGRTHRRNQPTGTLLDRFREPVQRNDYIATTQVAQMVAGGDPLRDSTTLEDLRFVHVDSDAAAGGDGTFENPLTSFVGVSGASQDDDTILVHAASSFGGQYTLKDGQRVIGEGGNIVHTTNTAELGVINLPETSLGALAGLAPVIAGAGDVFTMANNNEINNFTINGGTRAVVANGVNSPVLRNLIINNPTGDGIAMTNITGVGLNSDLTITTTAGTGFLVNGGESIAATGTNTIATTTGIGLDLRNVSIDQTNFMFDRISVTAGATTGINLDTLDGTGQVIIGSGLNPGDGGTLTVAGTAIQINEVNNVTFSNVSVANTAVGSNGVDIVSVFGNEAFFSGLDITTEAAGFSSIGGGELSVTGTNTITAQTGTALKLEGNVIDVAGVTFDRVTSVAGTGTGIELKDLTGGTVTVGPDTDVADAGGILATAGTAITVENVAGATFNDVTINNTTATGVNVTGQTAGTVLFNNLALTTTTADAVTLENNAGGAITFDKLMASSTAGNTMVIEGGGTVTVTDDTSTMTNTGSGSVLLVRGDNFAGATGDATVAIAAAINNSGSGRSLDFQDRTSNNITLTGDVMDTGEGMLIQNNSGFTTSARFEGKLTFNTGVNSAIQLANNTGTNIGFVGGLEINTTSGIGFQASGGGSIGSTGTNTIATTTGIGLDLNDMTIDAAGLLFDSVTVTNGTTGINLDTLVAANSSAGMSHVTIGSGLNPGDGGTLTVSGTAIRINDVDRATFNNVTINNTAAGSNGVVLTSIAGDETFFSGLNVTTDNIGFSSIGGGELSVTGTNTISTTSGSGLLIDGNVIDVAGVTFDKIDVAASTNAIVLRDFTGGIVTVGPDSGVAADGGTLVATGTAITVDNVSGAVFNDITIDNSATTGAGINVTNQAAGTVRFENTNVTTDSANAVTIAGNTAGTIEFNGLTATADNAGNGISINEANGSTVAINFSDITVNANGTGNGFTATGGGVTTITGTNVVNSIGATAFVTNEVQSLNATDVTIVNSTQRGVEVLASNLASGTVSFTDLNVTTTSANALTINGYLSGTLAFDNLVATTSSGAGNAISIVEADTSVVAINFNDITANATGGTGSGFTATGGGVTTITGTNAVSSIGATAFVANDVQNLTAAGVTIANTTQRGLEVTGTNNASGAVSFTDLDVTTTTADAVTVDGNTMGTITFNGVTTTSTNGDGITLSNNAGATLVANNMNITATGSGDGFIASGGGTLSGNGTNTVNVVSGEGVNVNGMTIGAAGLMFESVNVTAGAGDGITLDTLTGGPVTIGTGVNPGDGGTLVVTGTAIRVNDVDTATFSNIVINNTAVGSDGVIVTNSAGDQAFFSGMDITSERVGFDATGGELTVTGTNTISTVSGPALDLNSLVVNNAGVTFDSVSISAGSGMGIVLEDLTGGTVTVGPNTGVLLAGGMLTTADTSISVTNVENAVFNDVGTISGTADAVTVSHSNATDSDVQFNNLIVVSANDSGLVITAAGAGEFDVSLQDSAIGTVGMKGVSLVTNVGSDRVDLTLLNNTITAADDNAFAASLGGGSGDVRFLLDDTNVFTNNSATEATLDITVTTALELNATITDNTFTNSNAAGTAFEMLVNEATDMAMIDLNLASNTANLGAGIGNGAYDLTETAGMGIFRVVDRDNANANNTGTVNFTPNIAAFDDITDGDVALPTP